MVTIRQEIYSDVTPREALLTQAFGPQRFLKTSQRLREQNHPAAGLAFTALDDSEALIGTLRLWPIEAGTAGEALLLGPLAVSEASQALGVGSALMRHGLQQAKLLGHRAILLVGDAPYYSRFGFSAALTEKLLLPGPVDRDRFLGLDLMPGALSNAQGLVKANRHPQHRQAA